MERLHFRNYMDEFFQNAHGILERFWFDNHVMIGAAPNENILSGDRMQFWGNCPVFFSEREIVLYATRDNRTDDVHFVYWLFRGTMRWGNRKDIAWSYLRNRRRDVVGCGRISTSNKCRPGNISFWTGGKWSDVCHL
jgi:hypothetical protein